MEHTQKNIFKTSAPRNLGGLFSPLAKRQKFPYCNHDESQLKTTQKSVDSAYPLRSIHHIREQSETEKVRNSSFVVLAKA